MQTEFSINELAKLTGKDPRTIKKRLAGQTPTASGKWTVGHLYDGLEAFVAGNQSNLDLAQERALLAKEQRLKLERERHQAEGTIAGSVTLEKAHQIMTEVAWVIGVTGRQCFLGQVHKISDNEDDYWDICELVDESYQYGIVSLLAQIQDERIPAPIKAGLLEGFAKQLNMSQEELKSTSIRVGKLFQTQTKESNDS
jgi:hypothetical protein